MPEETSQPTASQVPLPLRVFLVSGFWAFAFLILFIWTSSERSPGLLIRAMGEEDYFIDAATQNLICILFVVTTWALLVFSRPAGFCILYGVLILLLLISVVCCFAGIGPPQMRYFP